MISLAVGILRFELDGLALTSLEGDVDCLQRFLVDRPGAPSVRVMLSAGAARLHDWRRSDLVDVGTCGAGAIRIERVEWGGMLDLDGGTAVVRLAGPWVRALQSFVGTASQAYALAFGVGAMYHSSCVVTDRGAVMFIGRSGAGKSTAAELSVEAAGTRIVAEDLTFVELQASGAAWVHTLPLFQRGGTVVGYERHRLLGVCALTQAATDGLTVMSASSAMRPLLRAVSVGVRVPRTMNDAAAHVQAAAAAVPVAELRFRKAPDFWHLVAERFGA